MVKAGDSVKVVTPANGRYPGEIRWGIVKSVGGSTGNIYWYCDPKLIDVCGMCGPRNGEGGHRLGMHRSYLA